MFKVFKRKAWRQDPSYAHGYLPDGAARRTTVCTVDTEEEARAICREANAGRPEYPRKAYFDYVWHEYTSA